MSETGIHILMTGGGAPGAAGILQCLWQFPSSRITVVDANPEATGRFLVKDFAVVPPAQDPAFVDSLLAICRDRDIHVILPLVTRELIPLAKRVDEFELAGARLILSPAASLEIANDKSRLYQFLQWRDIPVPDFRVVENIGQLETAALELGYPEKPICFKPSVANGSRGFRIIDEGMNENRLLFEEKPSTAFLRYGEAIRILSQQPFPELLVSEYLPGEEFSVDCLANKGQAVLVVPRLRTKTINGISVQGQFIQEPAIVGYCTDIIRELRLHGNIGIQVKRSAKGDFLLLEINPRVQGTISAGLGAGVNLPALAIKQELGLPIHEEELLVNWGIKFHRYWSEVFYQ